MLKLTKIDTPTEQRLVLEGRLTGRSAAEVCANWQELRHTHPEGKFVVDLRGVTRVDRDGEDALALMKREGAKFVARGLRVKDVLKGLNTEHARSKNL